MKADAFLCMAKFLFKHGQLRQVMIKQVQDLPKLSEEWNLTREERYMLYFECAQLLEKEGDNTHAFRLYYEAAKIVDTKQATIKPEIQQQTAQSAVFNAIKSQNILNFEEIAALKIVKELEQKAKDVYKVLQMFQSSDVASFQKDYTAQKKLFDQNNVTQEEALLKKQYIEICQLNDGQKLTFAELSKLLNIKQDDVEEWVV